MKLVIDTNTLISGSLWQGPSARLLDAALSGRARLFISTSLLLELEEVLKRPKFAARLAIQTETADRIVERFRNACHEITPAAISPPAELRDLDDLHVLSAALAAKADAIVTSDKDLLMLGSFESIPIINPEEALRRLEVA